VLVQRECADDATLAHDGEADTISEREVLIVKRLQTLGDRPRFIP